MASVSARGIALIKSFEGLRMVAYKDAAGVWTIGYGHTGADVYEGRVIGEEEAEALLAADLMRFEKGVESLIKVPLQQAEFDAVVSFAFNAGLGALRESTLLRLVNEGRHEQAAAEFQRWIYAGGKVLPGLVRRRAAEEVLYREGGRAGA